MADLRRMARTEQRESFKKIGHHRQSVGRGTVRTLNRAVIVVFKLIDKIAESYIDAIVDAHFDVCRLDTPQSSLPVRIFSRVSLLYIHYNVVYQHRTVIHTKGYLYNPFAFPFRRNLGFSSLSNYSTTTVTVNKGTCALPKVHSIILFRSRLCTLADYWNWAQCRLKKRPTIKNSMPFQRDTNPQTSPLRWVFLNQLSVVQNRNSNNMALLMSRPKNEVQTLLWDPEFRTYASILVT